MSAIVTPSRRSSAKPNHLVAVVLAVALVAVLAVAITTWATNDRGSTAPTRAAVPGNVESINAASPQLQSVSDSPTPPSAQSLNAASPELQSVNASPTARSVTAAECRQTGQC